MIGAARPDGEGEALAASGGGGGAPLPFEGVDDVTDAPACPTNCCSTGSNFSASACCRNSTRISVPLAARLSRSRAIVAKRETVPLSPRSASELLLSIATTEIAVRAPSPPLCPPLANCWSEAAISRAPAFLSAITSVDAPSLSIRTSKDRMRRILSA